MKRNIYIVVITVIIISIFNMIVHANEYDALLENTDEQTREYLSDLGIDEISLSKLFDITPSRIIKFLSELAFQKVLSTSNRIFRIIVVLIISSIALSFVKENNKIKDVISLVGTLVTISFIIEPISRMFIDVATGIKTSTIFVNTYLPIMTSIIIASRNPSLAVTYNSFSIYLSVLISNFADRLIIPISGAMLSFTVLSSFSSEDYKVKIIKTVRKLLIVFLSFFSTIYTGVLTTKSILATSSDSVAIKGIRFVSGTFIPVVGGNVGDAISSVFSSFVIMKNTLGVFIILVIILINLPIIVEMIIWYFVLQICSIVSSLFGISYITDMLENLSSIVSLLNIVMFFITFVLVISTGVIIVFGK